MNRRRSVLIYLFFDIISVCLSWYLLFRIQTNHLSDKLFNELQYISKFSAEFYVSLVALPVFWVLVYFISGYYCKIFRKSRLLELGQTAGTSLIGVSLIFFTVLLNQRSNPAADYRQLFLTYLLLHFGLTYFFRVVHTSIVNHRIHKRKIGFNTLLIGGDDKAVEVFKDFESQAKPSGHRFVGFVCAENRKKYPLNQYIPALGSLDDLESIIQQNNIEEIIVTIDSAQHQRLSRMLIMIQKFNVIVWGIPDLYDILAGNKKADNLYSRPLFKISNGVMPIWEQNVKRIIDVVFSVFALIISIPISLLVSILIKLNSRGPVIYSQERIGRFGKPFMIYKFRTMEAQAEQNGPQLTKTDDPRITSIGKFLRKTHLDEIPQFYNVLVGNMSLVGPRPEREFYIEQIVENAPQYCLLHKIRPGITSWGQVKYGYAENIEQMLGRLPYDLVYLKNASLYLDFKIMIYSVLEVLFGKGK